MRILKSLGVGILVVVLCVGLGVLLIRSIKAAGTNVLISQLKNDNPEVRFKAAYELFENPDKRAVEALVEALNDKDVKVRWIVAGALGRTGDKRAFQPLVDTLKDEDESVRVSVATYLSVLSAHIRGGEKEIETLIAVLRQRKDSSTDYYIAMAMAHIGEPAINLLIAALKDDNATVRWGAAEALGEIGDSRAVEPLITALKDEGKGGRTAVAEALGEIGDSRAIEPLITALREVDGVA